MRPCVYSEVRLLYRQDNVFTLFIKPHRSPTYVDAAYYYRLSSVVCRSVCRSVSLCVCLSVTLVSPAKTAEPIEMPLGLRTREWAHGTVY